MNPLIIQFEKYTELVLRAINITDVNWKYTLFTVITLSVGMVRPSLIMTFFSIKPVLYPLCVYTFSLLYVYRSHGDDNGGTVCL